MKAKFKISLNMFSKRERESCKRDINQDKEKARERDTN